jgi:hypothetical protein
MKAPRGDFIALELGALGCIADKDVREEQVHAELELRVVHRPSLADIKVSKDLIYIESPQLMDDLTYAALLQLSADLLQVLAALLWNPIHDVPRPRWLPRQLPRASDIAADEPALLFLFLTSHHLLGHAPQTTVLHPFSVEPL